MKLKHAVKLATVTGVVAMYSSLSAAALTSYSDDFEGQNAGDGAALGDSGWLVGANVFDSGGNYLYGYFAFPAPNGGPAFSGVATGEGGLNQGSQQLNTYNDYNNADHGNGSNNQIEANIFREIGIVGAGDVGKQMTFLFDAKVGNLAPPTTSTAFMKVLKTSDSSFATLDLQSIATEGLGTSWTEGLALSTIIDASWVGETVQIGFTNTASNFNPSGVFYDNLSYTASTTPAVPVPAAAWLFGSALAGLVAARRKK